MAHLLWIPWTVDKTGLAQYREPFAIGAHTVSASYSGDSSYAASQSSGYNGASASYSFTVVQDPPTILPTINGSATGQGVAGQPTVLTIQVVNSDQDTQNSVSSNRKRYADRSTCDCPDHRRTVCCNCPHFRIDGGCRHDRISSDYRCRSLPNHHQLCRRHELLRRLGFDDRYHCHWNIKAVDHYSNCKRYFTNTARRGPGHWIGHRPDRHSCALRHGRNLLPGQSLGGTGLTVPTTGIVTPFSFSFNSQLLGQGANLITFVYSGDTNYQPSTTTLNLSNPLTDFTMVPQSAMVPVYATTNSTDTIHFDSLNGFAGALTLTCTAATGATCSIPSPVTLAAHGTGSAVLTLSAPSTTTSGTYTVQVTATDPTGDYVHTVGVQALVTAVLVITNAATLPTGYAGTAYTQTLAATGGSGKGYTWSVTTGGPSLTAVGLSLSSAGVLSGATPTAGSASFTAMVTDSVGHTASVNFSVTINPALSISTAATLPTGYAGVAYSQTLAATGGSGTGYTWTVTAGGTGLTAVGLSLSSAGVLSGATPIAGSASFTAKVTDSVSNTASVTFSVTVNPALTITTAAALPTGYAGVAYSKTLAVSGGSGSGYTWTVTTGGTSLTAVGLSLSGAGVLSGATPIAGSASFAAKVTDSASNSATVTFTVTINPALAITTAATLPTGYVGTAYTQTLAASGGSGTGFTWTVTTGGTSLTAVGLSLSSAGVLSGATPIAGSASFAAKVTDSASNTATVTFSVTVNPALAITTAATLPTGYAGVAYSQTLAATGGSGTSYTWTVTTGGTSLTAIGLSLSGAGVLSGTTPIADPQASQLR